MKRILFFLHLPPPIHGASIVGNIIKDGFGKSKNYELIFNNIGTTKDFSERRKTTLKKVFRFMSQFSNNLGLVLSKKPDLVYLTCSTFGIGFVKDSIYILICKLLNINFILHFHNKGFHKKSFNRFSYWYHNFILNSSKAILLSESLEKYYLPFLVKENIYFLGNGIKDYSSNLNFTFKDDFRILFVSNLVLSKGILELIDIAIELKNQSINFKLDIVGNQAELTSSKLLQIISNNGLEDFVFYHGALYEQDKWNIFKNASIFLYPSKEDCFPLVLLEALSFGLPIICSNEGALSDIVINEVNGFVINDYLIDSYVDKIKLLYINRELLTDISFNCRKRYELNYTEDVFINNFEVIINKIL